MSETGAAPAGPARQVLRRVIFTFALVAVVGTVVAVFAARLLDDRTAKSKRFLDDVRRAHGGRVAWIPRERDGIAWLDLADVRVGEEPSPWRCELEGTSERVLWSSDGSTLFVVTETGTFDTVSRIEAVDAETRQKRMLLDLGVQHLEDNDLVPAQVYVVPFGEAEVQQDRLVFQLGNGMWYSVEGKRARVRPEPGPPAKPWDQGSCTCGKHRLVRRTGEDDAWLELQGPGGPVKITGKDIRENPAWWCGK